MGRIKKAAGPKHDATLSPALSEFVATAVKLPLSKLPSHLRTFPSRWPFPRGDLYHWIPLLDRFDIILENFNRHYGLNSGPQVKPFTQALLGNGVTEADGTWLPDSEPDHHPSFGKDGDRELVECILQFSTLLVENCGNRSLYNSSDRLGDLLNTTSLSLLTKSLRLAVRLAQRYHASRARGGSASQHLNNALLASHYNINLDHVQKLANPFVKTAPPPSTPTTATSLSGKGKEKSFHDTKGRRKSADVTPASDMYTMARDEDSLASNAGAKGKKASRGTSNNWVDWGSLHFTYYYNPPTSTDEKKPFVSGQDGSSAPPTPTPARRASGLSRPSRLSSSEESSNTASNSIANKSDESVVGGLRHLELPYSKIASTRLEEILESALPDIPRSSHYDFLCRLRVAHALSHSLSTRRQILGIRILAFTNLAYIYPEASFQQRMFMQDIDEPRRLQLPYQLADLIHPPGNDDAGIPVELKTIALGALEALTKHKMRATDVCNALGVNVNHGVLLYILRKGAAELAVEDGDDEPIEADECREALYSLLEALPSSGQRTAESLVAAGLFDILIDVLNLRTNKAERNHPKVLIFLNNTLYSVRDAFQTFANAKGLDTIAELTAWEVSSSLQRAQEGGGLPARYRNQVMDYQVPYFQQQTLRWIFKFINHMMSHGTANFDRLLRNLIDSPKLLNGLLTVISNAPVFGSNVWSGSVNILSSFIHNEPTSYAVIAEAGLSKGFLEAITQRPISSTAPSGERDHPEPTNMTDLGLNGTGAEPHAVAVDTTGTQTMNRLKSSPRDDQQLGQGILPATDAIVTIPHAFGAICLNTAGLQLFLDSRALESFFEIFRSPNHIKSLIAEIDLPRMLGNSFDELVRHHPRLRNPVMESVIAMMAEVSRLCKTRASSGETGAKIWTAEDESTNHRRDSTLHRDISNENDEDIDMSDAAEPPVKSEIAQSRTDNGKTENTDELTEPSVTTYINVAIKFLNGFFDNTSLCPSFIESGGVKHLLEMATLPSLPYDFNSDLASSEIARVLHTLIEQKPHLVLPSLLRHTQDTVDELRVFTEHDGRSAFFSSFIGGTNVNSQSGEQGTVMIKSLVRVHTLCSMLCEAFSTSAFTSRPNHTIFTQLNLTDIYIPLIQSLGRLHRACIWEEVLLQKSTPLSKHEPTSFSGDPSHLAEELADPLFVQDTASEGGSLANQTNQFSLQRIPDSARQDDNSAISKNLQSLRFLLSQIPTAITPFLQGLGKALVTKRRADAYQRQCSYSVAEAIAKASIEQLNYEAPKSFDSAKDRYAYWIVVLNSISQLMIEGPLERPHSQCLSLIMQAFTSVGGLEAIKDILQKFLDETKPDKFTSNENFEEKERLASAYGGIKIILTFFAQITSPKCIVDSVQTQCIASHDRDRDQAYFFLPAQFLVELRMAVLPKVKSMWDSSFVDKASNSILKCLIEILKTILDGEQEQGAFKKSDPAPNRIKPPFKTFTVTADKVNTLQSKDHDPSVAREALYRCLNSRDMAEEYCKAIEARSIPSLPPPSYDQEKPKTPSPTRTPQRQDSQATIPDPEHASQPEDISIPATETNSTAESQATNQEEHQTESIPDPASAPPPAPNWPPGMDVDEGEGMAMGGMTMNIDNLLNITDLLNHTMPPGSEPTSSNDVSTPVRTNTTETARALDLITVDDLEEERSEVRLGLIDRALDVLNVHGDITWELAELITVGVSKVPEATTMRKEIGATLVQSLISYQMEDDFRPAGKKIAAGANLLALVMQEQDFYDAALDELKDNLGQLCKFIKIFPDQTTEEPSPWVGQVLLIVEKLLAEDVQPEQIKWTPPESNESPSEDTIVEMTEPLIPFEEKLQILDALTDILPRIGKDETLAISVVRILVILSRNREIATKLGDKRNMHRLFLMVKQLSGTTNEKLQSSFMLVLRHIIEDDETIRQIMRSEIAANFETRTSRPADTTGYVRAMYHLVLRSPPLFVEVTNEMLKLQHFEPSQRPQTLILKPRPSTTDATSQSPGEASSSVDPSNASIKSSTEQPGVTSPDKAKVSEIKAPVVEHPDGVIHYLLSQLLTFKDVEDKEFDIVPPIGEISRLDTADVEMTNGQPSRPSSPTTQGEPTIEKKVDKPELKAEQHPIYVYRCFLLQCLTELLSSYNRCKIEFINFSRKADAKAMTPSKPRSGVLNYLLNAVIPIGTLNSEESLSYRKKSITSNWGISSVVSLCWKTGEKGHGKKREHSGDEQEPDLLFVRKFVLEHALKAYKDATTSNEPLDAKYARMLSIADLFSRMLSGRLSPNPNAIANDIVIASQEEIAKIMFEKGFISAFTSSIADIDLNFPNAKRAVRYILKPLKVLTSTAIVLSETSSISTTPGPTDDDEISTASSASEMDGEREETPDLFRNSALGILEPGQDVSTSESSDDDEDMYDEEYDDGMEYEEEIERDGDEVVSDEDEEIEGAGHLEGLPGDVGMDVEVVLDGEDDEGSDEDPDDSEDMDEMDDGGEIEEIIDEINGGDENGSLADGDEEWQDEDEDPGDFHDDDGLEHEHDHEHDGDTTVHDLVREMQNARDGLAGLEAGRSLELDIENEVYMDDVVRDEDDEDDDDEEDEMDDEDVIYEPDFDDGDHMPDPPWGWEGDEDPPVTLGRGPRHHHHHHHTHRTINSPWTILPQGMDRGVIMPTYRTHRGNSAPRGADDGTNPLLQRHGSSGNAAGNMRTERAGLIDAAAGMTDWVHGMEPGTQRGGPVSFVNNIISAIGQGGPGFGTIGGPHGALHFHIAGNGSHLPLPREIQAVLGLRRPPQETPRSSRDDPMYSATFLPTTTVTRWMEEGRLLFGNAHIEKTQRVINSLLRILVPPAIEEENARKEKNKKQLQEQKEQKEKLEEQRLAKEKAEKEAQEKKEQEEREAAERAAAETNAAVAQTSDVSEAHHQQEASDQNAMEGVETAQADEIGEERAPEAGPSDEGERVRATFRGREVDITGLGIDLEYLDALPEELREEVLMQQLAEQRSQAAAAGEEPTDISREFLEALPPEIRQELLEQEASDRRRREREENRRRAAANGGAPAARAEEMDPASFLASLDPHLRQAVLMEQDDEVLAQLPATIAAEARALGNERTMRRWGDFPRLGGGRVNAQHLPRPSRELEQASKKPQRKQIVQMLDKAGVATLLRLMFIPLQGTSWTVLNDILHNVSQNRQNRAEIVSLLLSILQDGSADVSAVERSFQHLSLRAKQQASQKTPQPLKRTLTGQTSAATNVEMTPLMVVQQCLSALNHLTGVNPHIPSFFLTEHETSPGIKGKSNKKGKAKETRASKFALNALLSLLDRELIMESSSCMEQLSTILQCITQPLTILLRKEKDRVVEEVPNEEPSTTAAQVPLANGENTQNSELNSTLEDTPMIENIQPQAPTEVSAEAENSHDLPTNQPTTSTQPTEEADSAKNPESEEKPKSKRNLTPPFVPETNLRLVVNILAARECSAKTFRDTLSTINNLSAIPDAREVFGKELIKQAQDLGEAILRDLDELVPQIRSAGTGTDVQGIALARFSPSSSDQAKLLRVLTALDYLFDPKRNGGKTKPATENGKPEGGSAGVKDDILTTLYENSTFGPLWTKLSECLSAIRQRENTLNIATILLPLVEALMVVCKNTTLKEGPLFKAPKEFAVTSPPPESRMESLFFRFTEDHRKILNDLVRHNPKLMIGTFSLLVKNPKVLEFDNKRNYFTRRLHSRGTEARHPQPPLQLSVRRDRAFLDSFKSLYFKSGDEIKYGKLSIRFHGEEGVDAGGVTREWFQVMSRQMFDANYALFVPVASDRTTFHPNKLSNINPEHLMFFKFIGRVIGKALYEGRALDCHFSRAVYKRILGKPVSIKDMETLDLDYYKSLLWMLENDITDIITETFSIEVDNFGVLQIVDLIENGRNVPVTEENKQEYIQLVVEYRLTGSVKDQLEEFLKGFHDVVPSELISIFDEQELELLISGLPDIDIDDWKSNTEYHNYSASSPQIQWFWRAVRSFDKEERAKLLQFVTGTSKVPLNGFKELEGMNGFSRFNIHRDYGNKDRLPSSHTCFNQLDLPEYESYEALRQQVYTAMTAGSEYFGFA